MSSFTVLLVEPDPANVSQVRESLTVGAMRSEVQCVANPDQAVQFLRGEERFSGAPRPDAIVLTWTSSDAEAARLRDALARDPQLRKIPVIRLTAQAPEPGDEELSFSSQSRMGVHRHHQHHAMQ